MTLGRGAEAGLDVSSLRPVSFGTPDGVVVEAWRSRLPAWFAGRLQEDLAGLRRDAAERTAAGGGTLIDFEPTVVAGRPALRRVERLPVGLVPGVRYAATIIVVYAADEGVEISVTCRAPDAEPEPEPGAPDDPEDDPALARTRRIAEEIAAIIRFPGLATEEIEIPRPSAVPRPGHRNDHQIDQPIDHHIDNHILHPNGTEAD